MRKAAVIVLLCGAALWWMATPSRAGVDDCNDLNHDHVASQTGWLCQTYDTQGACFVVPSCPPPNGTYSSTACPRFLMWEEEAGVKYGCKTGIGNCCIPNGESTLYVFIVNDECTCKDCHTGIGQACNNKCCRQLPWQYTTPAIEMDEVFSDACFWDPNLGKWMCDYSW